MKHASYLLLILLCMSLRGTHAEPPELLSNINGKWSGKAPDGTEISYVFTKDGQLTWFVDEINFKKTFPKGLVGKYKILVAKPYTQIDISNFEHPAFKSFTYLGIIENIDKHSFRMEAVPSHPMRQNKRPDKFTKSAVIFQKVKESE